MKSRGQWEAQCPQRVSRTEAALGHRKKGLSGRGTGCRAAGVRKSWALVKIPGQGRMVGWGEQAQS